MSALELREADTVALARPEILRMFTVGSPEAYRQNGVGSAYDATTPAS